MKVAAVGIIGLGYGSFADCEPKFLNLLLNSAPRGVVENSENQTPKSAWLKILGNIGPEEMKKLSIIPSNIPITEPTMGYPSLEIERITLREELEAVYSEFSKLIGRGKVVASINLYEREESCESLKLVDEYLERMYMDLDSFMFFSPYGEREGNGRNKYGIYISTLPRPQEDQTIKLEEIMPLILDL